MSRHRIVRSMNYEDEYYDEEDEYSRSVEDNYCISPSTAAQFTWNREKNVNFASFMNNEEVIDEEDEYTEDDSSSQHNSLSDSATSAKFRLSEIDQGKLNSCLEEARNILGESFPEHILVEVIIENGFDLEASVNQLLTQQDAPKPQREPRQKRNRTQDDKDLDELDNLLSEISTCAGSSVPKQILSFGPLEKSEIDKYSLTSKISTHRHTNTLKYNSVKRTGGSKDLKACHSPVKTTGFTSSKLVGQSISKPKASTGTISLTELVKQKSSSDLKHVTQRNVATNTSQGKPSLSEVIAQSSSVKGFSPSKDVAEPSSLMKLIQAHSKRKSSNNSTLQAAENKAKETTQPSLAELATMHKRVDSLVNENFSYSKANVRQLDDGRKMSSMSSLLQTLPAERHVSHGNSKNTKMANSKANTDVLYSCPDFSLSNCLKTSKNGKTLEKDTLSSFSRDLKNDLDTVIQNPLENSFGTKTNLFSSHVLDTSLVSRSISTLGLVLCSTTRKRKFQRENSSLCLKKVKRYAKFACATQVKGRSMYKQAVFQNICRFDFDSLSPDDIVRQKQKQAFTRPNKEFTV